MKPTIGRIVHYNVQAGITRAAIITYVHSNTSVNLTVFDTNGDTFGIVKAPMTATERGVRGWFWPPRVE